MNTGGGNGTCFVDRCLCGEAQVQAVDDAVDAWHGADTAATLAEWLGLDAAEYGLWMTEPSVLPRIVEARRRACDGTFVAAGGKDKTDVAAEAVAGLLRDAAMAGMDACAVAARAVELCLSRIVDGPGGNAVHAVVEARLPVIDGPGRERDARLDRRAVTEGMRERT